MLNEKDMVGEYLSGKGINKTKLGFYLLVDAVIITMNEPSLSCKDIFVQICDAQNNSRTWTSAYASAYNALKESDSENKRMLSFLRLSADELSKKSIN